MSTILSNLRWILVGLLVSSLDGNANPRPNLTDPIDGVAILDTTKIVCTQEMMNLCQQCAKKTKSIVVYPWCCGDHEGTREWCDRYLNFGLP